MSATRHPLIASRAGGAGLRRPALAGTRLYVWQVVDTVRGSGNSISEGAEYLPVPERYAQAAVDYYADYKDEVDRYRTEEYAGEEVDERNEIYCALYGPDRGGCDFITTLDELETRPTAALRAKVGTRR